MPYPNLIPFPLSLLILYILMILPGVAPTYGRPQGGLVHYVHVTIRGDTV